MRIFSEIWLTCILYISFFSNIISSETTSWEFAVTTKDKIIFYDRNWAELTTAAQQFNGLSAVVYDETEDNIFFNDQEQDRGSIFLLKLGDGDENHIVRKLVQKVQDEHIQGIAYDPLERTIYWTDAKNHRIYRAAFGENGTMNTPSIFMEFTVEIPRGIAIDVCRRKLYWTNSNYMNGSIERASLSGEKHEVLITDVHMPTGIAVDYFTDRMFWLDNKAGNHYSVESASLTGSQREALVTSLYNSPNNLVVDRDYIYWTEFYQESVWKVSKTAHGSEKVMKVLSNFTSTPRGIITKTDFLQNHMNNPLCRKVIKEIRQRLWAPQTEIPPEGAAAQNITTNDMKPIQKPKEPLHCLNRGAPNTISGHCMCQNGFTGQYCEVPLCYNYCVHGKCSLSESGYAKCDCDTGFDGERCERDVCTGFCLNGGRCSLKNALPVCQCSSLYSGQHCEIKTSTEELCRKFCENGYVHPDLPWNMPQVCGDCSDNGTQAALGGVHGEEHSDLELEDEKKIKIIWFILVSVILTVLFLLNAICFFIWRFQKPMRPKIKKTYVVRKNLTPLTCRPSGAEQQCEITIENCCNMNVCDTPCFDPKALQEEMQKESRKEDKKKLLRHMMDTNGDLY